MPSVPRGGAEIRTAGFRAAIILGWALFATSLMAACGGGGGGTGAPGIALGKDVCAECGMKVEDGRFTAALRDGNGVQVFDSIECAARAVRKRGGESGGEVWLADFDTGVLHREADMTVVLADYPSPMGGGFAAFADPVHASSEAAARGGVTGRLADAVRGSLRRERAP
jgi:copper chaperone NosL